MFNITNFDSLSDVKFYICNVDKSILSNQSIPSFDRKISIKFKDIDEISFKTYRYIDGELNESYDFIEQLRLIYIDDYGYFIIKDCSINSEDEEVEFKSITAYSSQIGLGRKYLNTFIINMGTDESIDDVQLYNLTNPSKSLLHLILEKYPDWTYNHIDSSLIELKRCFEVDKQDVYSFMMDNISTAFGCIFIFDTINNYINVYSEDTLGTDTNIHISYNNLIKSVKVTPNTDEIKTCLTITGDDDLTVREVNMGYDKIYNIDYYHSTEWMSQGLYDAYGLWKTLWNSKVEDYTTLVTTYQGYCTDINYLTYEMMPEETTPESTDWTLYGLSGLNEKLAVYQNQETVYAQLGYGDGNTTTGSNYLVYYKPNHDIIIAIEAEIVVRQNQINAKIVLQTSVMDSMEDIMDIVDMNNNFTSAQLIELSKFIIEDSVADSNYVVTDEMTDEEKIEAITEMLEYYTKELIKISQPVYEFTTDMTNLFSIEGFETEREDFTIGNYIHMTLRDDFQVKLRLLSIDFSFDDFSDFSVTFGNVTKSKSSNIFEDISSALAISTSAATSVSFGQSYWNRGSEEASAIGKMLSDGLALAGQVLSGNNSDISSIDFTDRGIFVRNDKDNTYPDDEIYIGNGRILFTSDKWTTVDTALGRIRYTKDGQQYDEFGLIAKSVISGYIASSLIESNVLKSSDYENGISGSLINMSDDESNIFIDTQNFMVSKEGNIVASNVNLSGLISATSGDIGGLSINDTSISYIKESSTDANNGLYISPTAIALGANQSFYVNYLGNLIAKNVDISGKITSSSGTIGGFDIGATRLGTSGTGLYIDTSLKMFEAWIPARNTRMTPGSLKICAGGGSDGIDIYSNSTEYTGAHTSMRSHNFAIYDSHGTQWAALTERQLYFFDIISSIACSNGQYVYIYELFTIAQYWKEHGGW